MSERATMPASYDEDTSREPVPLSRAVVETSVRIMLGMRDNGRLSTDGFISAVVILFDSILDGPDSVDTEVSPVNVHT